MGRSTRGWGDGCALPAECAQTVGGMVCAMVMRNAHASTLMDSWAFVQLKRGMWF